MPAATNNIDVTQTQLWTLALAWPGLTSIVNTANFIRYDSPTITQPDVTRIGRETLDQLPSLRLEIVSSSLDPKAPRTMCKQPDVNNVAFEWIAQGTNKTYNTCTQIAAELKACFISAGVQLGIPSVVARWTWEMRFNIAGNINGNVLQHREVRARHLITIKG